MSKINSLGDLISSFMTKPKAHKYLNLSSVSGILKMNDADLMKMRTGELRFLVNKLASAANKRIRRLQESKLASRSGAYRQLRGGEKHKGKVHMFTTDLKKLKVKSKGQERNKLLKEFARASRFLNDKTSTVTGTRKTIKDIESRLGKFRSKAQANRFWDAYNSVRSDYGDMIRGRKISTDEIQKMIYERMFTSGASPKGDAVDKVIDAMRKEMESTYVKQQTNTEGETPFSVRFEKIKIF